MNIPNLCLGTAQFGLDYGVTNRVGQVSEADVSSILHLASKSGIKYLDTAQAYGSAEQVIGRCVPPNSCFNCISKLPAHSPMELWESNFQRTLYCLGVKKLDSFLLHRAADLLGSRGDFLINWLSSLLDRNLVNRIGVSIYDSWELDSLPLDLITVVQLPLSIYDQRMLIDGTIKQLQSLGISVHARSLFLQGLFLQSSTNWPDFLSLEFRDHHSRFQSFLVDNEISPLQSAFLFSRSCSSLETLLFGVLSLYELQDIISSFSSSLSLPFHDFSSWAWDSTFDLDPRHWPK